MGLPLGFAADGSPYNQVISGDHWYTQEMWSQADGTDGECVQATQATIADSPLPLPTVNLTQFSPDVSGNIGGNPGASGVSVEVQLIRAGTIVADQTTTTGAGGNWSLTGANALRIQLAMTATRSRSSTTAGTPAPVCLHSRPR